MLQWLIHREYILMMQDVPNNKRTTAPSVHFDPTVPPPSDKSLAPLETLRERVDQVKTDIATSKSADDQKPSTSKTPDEKTHVVGTTTADIHGNPQPKLTSDKQAMRLAKEGYFNQFAGKPSTSTFMGGIPSKRSSSSGINPYIKHPAALAAQGASNFAESYHATNQTNIRGDYNVFMGNYSSGKYGTYQGMDTHAQLMNNEFNRKMENHNTFYDFMGNTFGLAGKIVGSLANSASNYTDFGKVDFKTATDQTGNAIDPSKSLSSTFSRDVHDPLKDNTVTESHV